MFLNQCSSINVPQSKLSAQGRVPKPHPSVPPEQSPPASPLPVPACAARPRRAPAGGLAASPTPSALPESGRPGTASPAGTGRRRCGPTPRPAATAPPPVSAHACPARPTLSSTSPRPVRRPRRPAPSVGGQGDRESRRLVPRNRPDLHRPAPVHFEAQAVGRTAGGALGLTLLRPGLPQGLGTHGD